MKRNASKGRAMGSPFFDLRAAPPGFHLAGDPFPVPGERLCLSKAYPGLALGQTIHTHFFFREALSTKLQEAVTPFLTGSGALGYKVHKAHQPIHGFPVHPMFHLAGNFIGFLRVQA